MFFNKEIQREIVALKERVKQLECPHNINHIVIAENQYSQHVFGFDPLGKKYCSACGKVLMIYQNKQQLLIDRNDLMKELIKVNEKKIKQCA